jgi:hypothetical protein
LLGDLRDQRKNTRGVRGATQTSTFGFAFTHVRGIAGLCGCENLRTVEAHYAGRFEPADTARSVDDGRDPRGRRMGRCS